MRSKNGRFVLAVGFLLVGSPSDARASDYVSDDLALLAAGVGVAAVVTLGGANITYSVLNAIALAEDAPTFRFSVGIPGAVIGTLTAAGSTYLYATYGVDVVFVPLAIAGTLNLALSVATLVFKGQSEPSPDDTEEGSVSAMVNPHVHCDS